MPEAKKRGKWPKRRRNSHGATWVQTRTGMRVSVVRAPGRACVWSASLLAVLATLGCGNTRRNAPGPSATGATSSVGGGSSGGTTSVGGATTELQALPSELHRLNGAEYRATVTDVLGASPPLSLPRDGEAWGYDNIAAVLGMDADAFELYYAAARTVADEVFASEDLKSKLITCQDADDPDCVSSFVSSAGLRLFRRPLLDPEVAAYAEIFAQARARGDSYGDALELTLVGLLSSAQFLYRMEFIGAGKGTQPLGPYELASRLSYLLWSSAPDEALLSAAEKSELSDDAQLSATLTRMWADRKSDRFVANFAGQWLAVRRLATHEADPAVYPDWNTVVAAAAETEVYDYFDDFLRQERDWNDFFRGRAHEVDGTLASFYGLAAAGSGTSVMLPDGERAGFLGSVAFLTANSLEGRTSPTLRGKFILSRLSSCEDPPAPPNSLELPTTGDGLTFRQRVVQISDSPACAACHLLMDPLGLAFEHYDGVGRYRDVYAEDGAPVDSSTRLPPSETYPNGLPVAGVGGVVQALADDPRLASCFVRHVYTYGLGRVIASEDESNAQLLAEQWGEGPVTIKALVEKLVLAKPFRFRSDGGLP